jgi:uncharacterized protein YndB with AHSA1/START domain
MAPVRHRVNATPAAVFDVLRDGWAYSNWVVGTSHMRAVEADWPAAGSRLFHSSGVWPLLVEDETQVEEMSPDHRLVLTARGRPLGQARVEITLGSEGTGTVVTLDEIPVQGPGRWFYNPLAERLLRHRNEETLARLAAIVERRASP